MFISFFTKSKCFHDQITPDMDSGYCPDCGEYVQNRWFITRCSCCGVKQKTIIVKGQISADAKYCRNCGNNVFAVEKLNKINLVDINYAVVIKHIVAGDVPAWTQTWVEPKVDITIKLIPNLLKR